MEDTNFPKWLEGVVDKLLERGVFGEGVRPDQCTIQEYMPGKGLCFFFFVCLFVVCCLFVVVI